MLDEYNTCPCFVLTYNSPEFEPKLNVLPIWNAMLFLTLIGSSKQGTGHNRLIFYAWFPKASRMCNKFWNMRVKAI
jgi:hypothetical protein